MKVRLKVEQEFGVKFIKVKAGVRYWEDSDINGIADTECGFYIPCKKDDYWCPVIDIDTGIIVNWKQGVTANIHYKVCDQCSWTITGEFGNILIDKEDEYVPDFLCPKDKGYGDYIIMDIDENGQIANWKFNEDYLK